MPEKGTCLSFISFNARSLFNKMDELRSITSSTASRHSLIAVCETWCRPDEPDTLYNLPGYTLHRADRNARQGGGVAVYVRSDLSHSLTDIVLDQGSESLWITIQPSTEQLLTLGCVYRPPGGDANTFCQSLEHVLRHPTKPFLIFGDFNAKNSAWYHADPTDAIGESLSFLFNIYGLQQHVDFPTHIHHDRHGSCLDLVLSSFSSSDVSITCAAPLGKSDHVTLAGEVHLPLSVKTPKSRTVSPLPKWRWTQGALKNAKATLQHLSIQEEATTGHYDTDSLWNIWRSKVLDACHRHCSAPTQRLDGRPFVSPKPWITRNIINQVSVKHQLYRRYLRTHLNDDWQAFTKQRNLVTSLLRRAKSDFVCAKGDSEQDISRLHTLMNAVHTKGDTEIPDIISSGTVHKDPLCKATAFNKFFISQSLQSVSDGSEPMPPVNIPQVYDTLETFTTTPEEVQKLLRCLDTSKSAGYDGLPTRILKEAAKELAPSLTTLFNVSFSRGDIPRDWRDATVSPIHKKGKKSEVGNYRPISLLSVVSKVQERIVHTRLFKHIEPHLPANQSGFRPGDGTEQQLARIIHSISSNRDSGHNVLACFFDLSKAFDRVWHEGLLHKLQYLNVTGTALQWFRSYLLDRRQRVQIKQQMSDWIKIPAGVPQGSVLGPLLFNIYTIDLPSTCTNAHSVCNQFADDTAIITSHPNFNSAENSLQSAVSSAAMWLSQWHLLVNAEKTKVMHFHHGNRPPARKPCISLNGQLLSLTDCHRHLGLLVHHHLTWGEHARHLLRKAAKSMGHLFRFRNCLTPRALLKIYLCYIRPILEYPSLVLSPLPQRLSDSFERLQRKAARLCFNLPLFTPVHHSSLLHRAEWPTLDSRRRVKHVMLAHSLHCQYAPPHLLQVPVPAAPATSMSLRHSRAFRLLTSRTNRLRDSPINCSLTLFNDLPVSVRNQPTKESFKKSVQPLLLSSICSCSDHPAIA